MKKKALILFSLCIMISLIMAPAFATNDNSVTISGQVLFEDEPYSYVDDAGTTWICFLMNDGASIYYMAVPDMQYSYFKNAFSGCSLTLKCEPVTAETVKSQTVRPYRLIEGETETLLVHYLLNKYKGTEDKPNFYAYADLLDYSRYMIVVGEDGSYLSVDTDPFDAGKDSSMSIALNIIAEDRIPQINSSLGLPDWLYQEMITTRALDGRQKEIFEYVTVTWSYHPDKGLEIIYRLN